MITLSDNIFASIGLPLDARLSNLEIDGSNIVVESIDDYLVRVDGDSRYLNMRISIFSPSGIYTLDNFVSLVNDETITANTYTFSGGIEDSDITSITSEGVTSVNGYTETVTLTSDDITEGTTNLYYSDDLISANSTVISNSEKVSADGSIDTHSDVDTSTSTPTLNQVLTWDGTNWVPGTPDTAAVTSVNESTGEVILTTSDISEGTNLYYTEERVSANEDVAANTEKVSADASINTHSDVDTTSSIPTEGQALAWDGSNWVPTDVATLDSEGNINLTTDEVAEGDTNLYYTEDRVDSNSSVVANTAKISADGSINTHSDVDTTTTTPVSGYILTWDGSNWVPTLNSTDNIDEGTTNLYYTEDRVSANSNVTANTAKVSANGSIDTHSDVDTTTTTPTSDQVLMWDGNNWVPSTLISDDINEGSTNLYYSDDLVTANAAVVLNTAKVSASGSIDTHSDVDVSTTTPTSNDFLIWDGTNWVPQTTTTDNITEGSTNLYYTEDRVSANTDVATNTEKVSASGSIDTHSDVDVSTTAPTTGDFLIWDGSNWIPNTTTTDDIAEGENNLYYTNTDILGLTQFKIDLANIDGTSLEVGYIQLNNATQSSVTGLYFSYYDTNGNMTINDYMSLFAPGSILLFKVKDNYSRWATYKITEIEDNSSSEYYLVTVELLTNNNDFQTDDLVNVNIINLPYSDGVTLSVQADETPTGIPTTQAEANVEFTAYISNHEEQLNSLATANGDIVITDQSVTTTETILPFTINNQSNLTDIFMFNDTDYYTEYYKDARYQIISVLTASNTSTSVDYNITINAYNADTLDLINTRYVTIPKNTSGHIQTEVILDEVTDAPRNVVLKFLSGSDTAITIDTYTLNIQATNVSGYATDVNVAISSTDTTPGVLSDKLLVDTDQFTLTVENSGGNEDLLLKYIGSIDENSDVDTTTTAPTANQVLMWDGSNWTPEDQDITRETTTLVDSSNTIDLDLNSKKQLVGNSILSITADTTFTISNELTTGEIQFALTISSGIVLTFPSATYVQSSDTRWSSSAYTITTTAEGIHEFSITIINGVYLLKVSDVYTNG